MEKMNPNDKLVAVFVGEKIIYVTPPEYYAKYMGGICLIRATEEEEND